MKGCCVRNDAPLLAWGLALAAVVLLGCSMPEHIPCAEKPPASFSPRQWADTWRGDAEALTLTPQRDGTLEIAIKGRAELAGKGAVLTARTQGWTLGSNATVRVTATAPDGELRIAVAVRTDQYYESPSCVVAGDAPQRFVFDLATNHFKSERSGWAHTDAIVFDAPLEAVELVVYPAAGQERRLLVKPVEVTCATLPPPPPPRSFQPLAIVEASAPPEAARYGRFEIAARIATACTNPFDPAEITVDAVLVSPAGVEKRCPGFLYAFAGEAGAPDAWRVRFSPDEEGAWTWSLLATTPSATLTGAVHAFVCAPSDHPGPLRVAPEHPLFFEHARGGFFYPIGHNVCWNSLEQYRDQFARMGRNGENWSRIWIAPWNCDIEWSPRGGAYEGLGRYNLQNAAKLDGIVEAAEENGLYLQLVLHEHCRLSAHTNPEWHNNPYNRKEWDGPCDEPRDFFTNDEARRLTRNRLRYIVARWGWSAHVMAWELFNEVDLTDDFRFATDTPWHREMAEHIKRIDPHGHMVTTSYIMAPNEDTYNLPAIDYTQSHVYMPDVVSFFVQLYPVFRRFNKPHFIAEFGRDPLDGVDAADTQGRVLHAGIWGSFMVPEGGNAMSWWWYDHIDPHNLYPHYAALSAFAKDVDRRRGPWSLQTARWMPEAGPEIRLVAMASPSLACAWLYNPEILPWSDQPAAAALNARGNLALDALENGTWTVEQWDTYRGRPARNQEFVVTNGSLTVPVDVQGPDTALKIRRAGPPLREGSVPRFRAGPWEPDSLEGPGRTPVAIFRLDRPVQIDARLDEWDGVQEFRVEPKDGRALKDNSIRFQVAHDGRDLLVAARVTDDHIVRAHTGNDLWKDDNLELWIDARSDGGFFHNMPHNPGCFQVNIAPAAEPGGDVDKIIYRNPSWTPEVLARIEAASRRTTDGYVIEARIPLAVLRGDQPVEDPARIGFNISTCDADPEGDGTKWKHLLWQGKDEWDVRQWAEGLLK